MPKTVKDIGDRYYSPNKYFVIGVEKGRPVKHNIHMSFDNIKMPEVGSKRNSFVNKLHPVLVNRMKQKLKESSREDLGDKDEIFGNG